MGAAREPGFRAKIAVSSIESDVDPVGACVGLKGSRVQNVVQELQGERIDIVPWSPDPAKYVYNALAPAEVSMVIIDDDKKSLLVVVPDDQLSLAIGRQGQNVRLASRLLGWKIDVKSEQRYTNLENNGYLSLTEVDGVDESLADRLFAAGITSAGRLAGMDTEKLMALARVDEEKARTLQKMAALVEPPEIAAVPSSDSVEDLEQDEDSDGNDATSQSDVPDPTEEPGGEPT
jgi:N utilization substance protein A